MHIHHTTAMYVGKGVFSRSSSRARPRIAATLRSASFLSRLIVFTVFLIVLPQFSARAGSGHIAQGRASWYGVTSDGKQTANGEIYNRNALTAAHKGLPFGTVVRVYNLRNDKHVLVRVNDRGPFVKGRIVDVSRRAAENLRMTSSGVVPVALEIVASPGGKPLNGDNRFYVHIANEPGALRSRSRAGMLEKKIQKSVRRLYSVRRGEEAFALCLGPYATFSQAQRDFLKLEHRNIRAFGIIEAPATGGNIPRHSPPRSGKNAARKTARHSPGSSPLLPAHLLFPHNAPLAAAPSLTVGKSFLFLGVVQHMLAALTEERELFRLPYIALSGYRCILSQKFRQNFLISLRYSLQENTHVPVSEF